MSIDTSTAAHTAADEFFASLDQKRARGLQDIKFFPGNVFDATKSQLFEELNRMDQAQERDDPEFF